MDQTFGDLARRDWRQVWRRLSLAVMLLLPLAVPLGWLALELGAARDRAAAAIAAAASSVSHTLGDLLQRFETVTAGLQLPDGPGGSTALTARLLRLEARLPPSTGLLVFNRHGRLVAGSHPLAEDADVAGTDWFQGALRAPSRAPIVFPPGATPLRPGEGAVIARRIDQPQGGAAGVVITVLPAETLRRAIQPAWLPAGSSIRLTEAARGQALLTLASPAPDGQVGAAPLLRAALAALSVLPGARPASTGVDITPGGLRWEAELAPLTILAAEADGLRRRGGWAASLAFVLVGAILLADRRAAGLARHRGHPAAPVQRATEAAPADAGVRLPASAAARDLAAAAIGRRLRAEIGRILTTAVLVLDDELEETQRLWVCRLRARCEGLLARLDGLLAACGAAADRLEIDPEEVDIAGLVREVCDVLEPQAQDKGLALRVVVEDAILGTWHADRACVRRVLFNLVEHAMTHTAQGAIEVRAAVATLPEGQEAILVQVTATGPGTDPAQQGIETADAAAGGQAGLDLAVAHAIAARLQGSLRLTSSLEHGSSLAFEFPATRHVGGRHPAPFAGRTALVIGFTAALRERLARQLQGLGFAVEGAADGYVGLGLAERLATIRGAVDLVLLDGALPGLPADVFLLRLRANRLLQSARVAWIASDQAPVPDGVATDAVIRHPPEPWDVEHVALELLGAASALQAVDPAAPTPVDGRILLVSDDKVHRMLLTKLLARAGFPVFTASTADEAKRAARRARPDLILIDGEMADADGIAVTRQIRAEEGGGVRPPIIVLAGPNADILRRQYRDAGADAVLAPPAGPMGLAAQLRQLIAANRATLPQAESGDGATTGAPALDVADEHLEVLVLETGPERAAECVRAFLADITARVPRIEELLIASEWAAVRRTCNDLAGLASTVGAMSLADALVLLEDAARDGDAARAEPVMAEITAIAARLRSRLPYHLEVVLARRGRSRQDRLA